jgi:hypothetical protein
MDRSSRDSPQTEEFQARADQSAARPRMSRRIALALKRFVDHPTTKLVVGLILIASGLIETYDTVLDDVHHLRVRVGHGVLVLGVVNVLASLPEVIDGMERWLRYLDSRNPDEPNRIVKASQQNREHSDGDQATN